MSGDDESSGGADEEADASLAAVDVEPAPAGGDGDVTSGGAPPAGDEPFIRYTNPMYRVITMVGAALVLIFGVSLAVVSRMLNPPAPAILTLIDLVVTVALVTWYLTGLHIGLDLYEDRLVVAGKIGATTLDRDQVESVEPLVTWQTALLFSGRPLLIHLADGTVVRSYGCLPSDAQGQQAAVADLQAVLGATASVAAEQHEASMDERIEAMTAAARARQAGVDPSGGDSGDAGPSDDAGVVDEHQDDGDGDRPPE